MPTIRPLPLCAALVLSACAADLPSPLQGIAPSQTVTVGVAAPVDIVRDEFGVPHIYAQGRGDAAFAQGYVHAQDRLIQMDLLRHYAAGTLSELFGALDDSFIDQDIALRVHHLRPTAQQVWDTLQASTAADDQMVVQVLQRYSDGVNAYLAELQGGQDHLAGIFALAYDPQTAAPWTPVDSISLARLQAFDLSFDADTELARTQAEAAAFQVFDQSGDARLRTRRGLASDLYRTQPLSPAFIELDATSCGGATGMSQPPKQADGTHPAPATRLYDYAGLLPAVHGIGLAHQTHLERGSNNWIVAPGHSASGHALVANDTHLDLNNPPIFYLQHLSAAQDNMEVMGVQFPGLPGIVLGMNRHLAWGSTVNYADVTDLYEEHITTCDGKPCVMWHDPKTPPTTPAKAVLLVQRPEVIKVGRFGKITGQRTVTMWEVPQHGPLLPHIANHDVMPPGPVEISVRYTGHQPSYEVRAALRLNRAASVAEGMAALEQDFTVGSQNWVLGDDAGHIGWTASIALPVRPAGARPWVVMPGDGSAEWAADGLPPQRQPHAFDPSCGLLATANNDPLGNTRDGGVTSGPGAQYLGWDYDPGVRAGRITQLLQQGTQGGRKLALTDLQAIQGDHRSFLGGALGPVLRSAAEDLLTEVAHPGTFPDLAGIAPGVDMATRALAGAALDRLKQWQLGTPSGLEDEAGPQQVSESICATVFNAWLMEFHQRTLDDEFATVEQAMAAQGVSVPRPDSDYQRKLLLAAALTPEQLTVGRQAGGDSLLFDDLRTPDRIETRREIAVRALLAALTQLQGALGKDIAQWQWGKLHRLALSPLLPISELRIPSPRDPMYPQGVPRHGDVFSVDASSFGARSGPANLQADFNYGEGPAIRFVADLAPGGPVAFNVLPGGEVFDPESPHYADQFALWRRNQAFALPFSADAVSASAQKEQQVNGDARVRLVPKGMP